MKIYLLLAVGALVSLGTGVYLIWPRQETLPNDRQGSLITSNVIITSIQAVTDETNPDQISVLVVGSLPDPCSEISLAYTETQGNTFKYLFQAIKPHDAKCEATSTPKPFDYLIDQPLAGLEPGEYIIDVNGKEYKFKI